MNQNFPAAFRQQARASQRQCPEGATLRGLFMDYVEREAAAGRKIEARIEGRVVMKK